MSEEKTTTAASDFAERPFHQKITLGPAFILGQAVGMAHGKMKRRGHAHPVFDVVAQQPTSHTVGTYSTPFLLAAAGYVAAAPTAVLGVAALATDAVHKNSEGKRFAGFRAGYQSGKHMVHNTP